METSYKIIKSHINILLVSRNILLILLCSVRLYREKLNRIQLLYFHGTIWAKWLLKQKRKREGPWWTPARSDVQSVSSTSARWSPSMLAKPESRSATRAGSSTVWSTVSSQMARCPQTKPSVEVTIPLTRSSARPALASMCPEPSLLIWSLTLSVRFLFSKNI